MTQHTLFPTELPTGPAKQPAVIPATDPHVDKREQPRLGKQNRAILERLRQGRATNVQLAAIALKYTSRVSDLRAAGFSIEVVAEDHVTGMRTYALTHDPWRMK